MIHSNNIFVNVPGFNNRVMPQGIEDTRTEKPGIRAYCWLIGKILALFNFAVKLEAKNENGKLCIRYVNIESTKEWKARQEKAHHLNHTLSFFQPPEALDNFIQLVRADINQKKSTKESNQPENNSNENQSKASSDQSTNSQDIDYAKRISSTFNPKNIDPISPSNLEQTEKTVDSQVQLVINPFQIEQNTKQEEVELKRNNEISKEVDLSFAEVKKKDMAPKPNNNDVPNNSLPNNKTPVVLKQNESSPPLSKKDLDPPEPKQNSAPSAEPVKKLELTPSQQIEELIRENNLEEAIRIAEKLPYEQEEEKFCKIVDAYFQQGNFDKIQEILKKRVIRSEIAHQKCKNFAITCCRQSKYWDAYRFLREISIHNDLIRNIFLDVAEEHYQNREYEKVIETVSYLKNLHIIGSEDYYLKIGQEYINQGILDKAETTLLQVIHNSEKRNELLAILAKEYYEKRNFKKAIEYNIKNVNYQETKDLYIKIAQEYKKEGNDIEALNALKEVSEHGYLIDNQWAGIVSNYLDNGNYDDALESIRRSELGRTY